MHDRMKKHFTVQPRMVPLIWRFVVEYGEQRMRMYERVLADCYQLRLDPSAARGRELLDHPFNHI